ncbi:sensor histidine kinase [Acidipila sp. EB88]|uniref:sensor histidine kinase n=1 Tax=Acidipila sp. EB88 TaxID=2305226 RepID=UPI000F5E63A3|nr:ATP-binding protein [Acidipila sp. EB88]RRA47859.1 GHKL domain-containing protein [Acidipila sp. EB88]
MANQTYLTDLRTPAAVDEALLADLRSLRTLKTITLDEMAALEGIERVEMQQGAEIYSASEPEHAWWGLLDGEILATKRDGQQGSGIGSFRVGDTFGEVPIMLGMRPSITSIVAVRPTRLLRVPVESFWQLMAKAPLVRKAITADALLRFQTYQAMTLHREKLISLGTLAAGLMHELNNPGAAARRAAAQLRENITRLQHISLTMTKMQLTPEQLECLGTLQEQVLSLHQPPIYSPLEQSDREEALSEWLSSIRVENPWRLAPALVSAGWCRTDIDCARNSFPPGALSNALNYLEALISSMQQVGTIEESISHVTDLVGAVKKYAYDDKSRAQLVDVRDTLLSTLTILSHKFRHKGITIERSLPSAETRISCVGAGLTQVWTNLLDNAIDAAPEGGSISVRLWTENNSVCVAIKDDGPGIPQEHWEHIFEPFYTTKAEGVGTGLGLDIAHRIVVSNFHGDIQFTSAPGATEFIVRLPIEDELAGDRVMGCNVGAGQAGN